MVAGGVAAERQGSEREMEFIKLFEPIDINGKLRVENRIVLPAMGLAYTQDYSFNERLQGFYRERAPAVVQPAT